MKTPLGIICTGGEGPRPQMLQHLLKQKFAELLGSKTEAVLIAAADSGLILAEAAGLRPDWIIGDMDSLDNHGRLSRYPADRVIRHPADKAYTDTELALSLLWEQGCHEVWIAGGGGGRIDHLFGVRDLFERERFPRRWLTAAEDIYCIDGAMPDTHGAVNGDLSLNLEPGTIVSVFPLGGGPWQAESAGLKWPLAPVRWERGYYGLSNVALERDITIHARQGRFMVIMSVHAAG